MSLSANSGAHLKALLKVIIQRATSRNDSIDEDEDEQIPQKKGPKLLNYDLQILSDYVKDRQLRQVILAIQDTEAFGSDLLSELIEVLGCWQDRIPFVFLLNIATSIDILQQRLSQSAAKCLQGRLFDVAPSAEVVEHVFEAITNPNASLWIGPTLMDFALERQNDYVQSIHGFVDAMRYAYMSCYYANALSIFLDRMIKYEDVPDDHFEALRNVPSFHSFCRQLLENNEGTRLRDLLDSDEILYGLVKLKTQQGREALADMAAVIDVISELQRYLQNTLVTPKSKLYVQAMSNKLGGSTTVRSLLLSARKASSNKAIEIMDAVINVRLPDDIRERARRLMVELSEMMKVQANSNQPLRSEDDLKNSTLRTTVVAQKVELSKQKSYLSKEDAAYTAVLRRFTELLEEFFNDKLINPKELLFNEIFLYDFKSPHREVFTPKSRHAIERALAAPHDYLDCDCCTPGQNDRDEMTLAASQPVTAVLYQLYLESGSLINASDLRQAFLAVMGDERSEEQNMALFQRALAELRYLGLVKSTRKRVDHVAKVAWRGL